MKQFFMTLLEIIKKAIDKAHSLNSDKKNIRCNSIWLYFETIGITIVFTILVYLDVKI
jgi:hypothetical protein